MYCYCLYNFLHVTFKRYTYKLIGQASNPHIACGTICSRLDKREFYGPLINPRGHRTCFASYFVSGSVFSLGSMAFNIPKSSVKLLYAHPLLAFSFIRFKVADNLVCFGLHLVYRGVSESLTNLLNFVESLLL